MPDARKCPTCGAELPGDAQGVGCVRCQLGLGLAQEQENTGQEASSLSGEPTVRATGDSDPGEDDSGTALVSAITENPGDRIGRYKLLQKIGEGGCGVVYMAQQEEPVRRRVALKVIKLGMDTKQVIARFEAERQALALMDHPNIAKVLDAGSTDAGRPYFVMELVRGIRITDYCDENKLPTRERLALFTQVCYAIQHAHQKGIIHRDIKPSNILVADNDGVPVPKVIDFGIAKATTGQELTDKTLFTALEQFIGTPAYMSPEQAKLSALDVDTRSDIYSLGVLLYELLTGKTPFDSRRLLEAGFDEIRRIIREEEPPRPSNRLSTLAAAEQTTVAKQRQSEPPKLVGIIRGDLDWIVMMALEKDRQRRFRTATGFAEDIENYLKGLPVAAHPPSPLYLFRKTVKRNKLVFTAAAAVSAALVIGIAVSSWQAIRAKAAERRADLAKKTAIETARQEVEQRQRADQERRRAEQALNDLEMQRLEDLFTTDSAAALAGFAKVLRQDSSNEVAPQRIMSALTQRNFPLLAVPTLKHDAPVNYVEFSPDGRYLLTLTSAGTARLWDAQTGQFIRMPLGHTGGVEHVTFSPDGRRLATASTDKTARVWEIETGLPVTGALDHEGVVRHVQFSPNGECVVTASEDCTAKVWDSETGRVLLAEIRNEKPCALAQFSPNGRQLITIAEKAAFLWNAMTGQPMPEPLRHSENISSVHFSPDGRKLVTSSYDRTARIWDAENGKALTVALRHDGWVRWAAFSPNSQFAVTASSDGTARIWDARTGQPMGSPMRHNSEVCYAEFSPDGWLLVTASYDGSARIWDGHTGSPVSEPLHHDQFVSQAVFSPDGGRVATASGDGTVRIWDIRQRRVLTEHLHHHSDVSVAAFSPDGRFLATGSHDGTARIWDSRSGRRLIEPIQHSNWVSFVQFSPDGRRIATASYDGRARLWDVGTGLPLLTNLSHEDSVRMCIFSSDGLSIATASEDSTARVWDARTGNPLTAPLKHGNWVNTVQFSPDSKRVVTASVDATVSVWDAKTGHRLVGPLEHAAEVSSAEFSPDGLRIVTASFDRTARIWDARTGEDLLPLLWHDRFVRHAHFSPDGTLVVTASDDGTARVWDVQTRLLVGRPLRHGSKVVDAQFSPDGRRIVTASEDKTARLWNVPSCHPLSEPLRHDSELVCVGFSPDGQWVVTGCRDGTAKLWDLPSGSGSSQAWLPDLAEAVAGQRRDDKRLLEPLEGDILLELKKRLTENGATDSFTHQAKWFFADRATRGISAFSPITTANYLKRWEFEEHLRSVVPVPTLNVRLDFGFDSSGFWRILGDIPDIPAVIAAVKDSVQGNPADARSYYWLHDLYKQINDKTNSEVCLAKAVDLYMQRVKAEPDDGILLAEFGTALSVSDKDDEAELILRQAVQHSPSEWKCWVALGWFLAGQSSGEARAEQMARDARDCFDKAVSVAPQEPEAYTQRTLYRLGQTLRAANPVKDWLEFFPNLYRPECLSDLNQAARLSSKDYRPLVVAAAYELIPVLKKEMRDKIDKSGFARSVPVELQRAIHRRMDDLQDFANANRQYPNVAAGALEALGIMQLLPFGPTQELATLRVAVSLDPSRNRSWDLLTGGLIDLRNYGEALAVCQQRITKNDSARARLLLASVYLRLERVDKVEEEVRSALRFEPNDFFVNLVLTSVLLNRSQDQSVLREAREKLIWLNTTADVTPENWAFLSLAWGVYHGLTGNVDEARRLVDRVLESGLEPDYARSLAEALGE